ncbi:MAG: protocatechuate 3,4-dioxygenase subunit alpha [Rubrobacter sp.]|nr:protocatechuate 3,4-dioxygenase subunit alpha [Rubrobacter sp.]
MMGSKEGLRLTPSQTVGPYLSLGLLREDWSKLVSPDHPQAIRIEGTLYDGAGEPVTDGLVEIWQAAPSGRYDHPADGREELPLEEGFHGFGRSGTEEEGRFSFVTLKPGPVPGPGGTTQAPHVMVAVFARGLLKHLITRIYFEDEEEANGQDPVLRSIGNERVRSTLIARKEAGSLYRFDIRLQGEGQTAFFKLSA